MPSSYSYVLLLLSRSFVSFAVSFLLLLLLLRESLSLLFSHAKRGCKVGQIHPQHRFAGSPWHFSGLNMPTDFLAEGLAQLQAGADVSQCGIAEAPSVSYSFWMMESSNER